MKLFALGAVGVVAAGAFMLPSRTAADIDVERTVNRPADKTYAILASELRDVARLRFDGFSSDPMSNKTSAVTFSLEEKPGELDLSMLYDDKPAGRFDVGVAPGEQVGRTRLTLSVDILPSPLGWSPNASAKDKELAGKVVDKVIQRIEADRPIRLAKELVGKERTIQPTGR